MTAWDIARSIMRDRYRRNFCLPNYTPRRWWECDVFELTTAGYFREYEIKLTRSDFAVDAKKRRSLWNRGEQNVVEEKHALLAAADPRGPTRFWYVTPAGLIAPAELPAWAGLIEVEPPREHPYWWRLRRREIVRAPTLHREKLPEAKAEHARSVLYWRLHTELLAMHPRSPAAEAQDTPA